MAEFPAPASITVGGDFVRGSEVRITWGAVSNAFSYELQRSINGVAFGTNNEDSWTINAKETSTMVDTAGGKWNTVQYRVRAIGYNDDGSAFLYSDWTVSDVKNVMPAPVPAAPSFITVEDAVNALIISWGASLSHQDPEYIFTLQRSVNGGTFQTVYTAENNSYVDELGTDWATVQYRVKVNVYGTDSDWTTSDVKNISPAPSASGRLEQFQNSAGEIIYPQTIVEGVFRKSDGKTLAELLEGTEKTPGVPDGGTAGQVLAKKTNADLDTEWIDPPDSGTDIVLPLSIENGGTGAADAKTALSALIDGSESQFPSTYYTDMYLPISVNGVCYKVPFTSIQKWTVGDRGSSVSQDNTSYGSFIARGIAAGTTDYVAGSTPMVNGTIYLVYE